MIAEVGFNEVSDWGNFDDSYLKIKK